MDNQKNSSSSVQNIINAGFDQRLANAERGMTEVKDTLQKQSADSRVFESGMKSFTERQERWNQDLAKKIETIIDEQKKREERMAMLYVTNKDFNKEMEGLLKEISEITTILKNREEDQKKESVWWKQQIWGGIVGIALTVATIYITNAIFS